MAIFKMSVLVCDFCTKPHPTWAFPVDTFSQQVGSIDATLNGGWAACEVCKDLVEHDKRRELADRALRAIPGVPKTGKVRGQVYQRMRRLHDEFFIMRSGPPLKGIVDPAGYEPGVIEFTSE